MRLSGEGRDIVGLEKGAILELEKKNEGKMAPLGIFACFVYFSGPVLFSCVP